jgi:hypothetical protein
MLLVIARREWVAGDGRSPSFLDDRRHRGNLGIDGRNLLIHRATAGAVSCRSGTSHVGVDSRRDSPPRLGAMLCPVFHRAAVEARLSLLLARHWAKVLWLNTCWILHTILLLLKLCIRVERLSIPPRVLLPVILGLATDVCV